MGKVMIWILGACFGMALIEGEIFNVVLCLVITLVVMLEEIIDRD